MLVATSTVDQTSSNLCSVADLPSPPSGKKGWPWTTGTKPWPSLQPNGQPWPKVSIVTPSYNQAEFLEASLRSVLLQGYPNLEYIVIDGGSSDASVEIIQKYAPYLSAWVSEPDQGQTDAINKGLKRSSGEIFAWLNSDDIYMKGAFQTVVASFLKYPDIQVIHGNRVLLDEEDRIYGCFPNCDFHPPHSNSVICSETAFWRREVMDKAGLLDTSYKFCMDLEFFSRLYMHGSFLHLDQYLGCLRSQPSSKSATIWNVAEEESVKIWKSYFQADWVLERPKIKKVEFLKEFIKHPRAVGLPYCKTKLQTQISKIFP